MESTENAAVMRRIFEEVINAKKLDLAEELYAEDHALYPNVAGVSRGGAGMKEAFAGLHEQFEDARAEIESLVADGEMVAVRVTFSGRPAGTGERIFWPEMVFKERLAFHAVSSPPGRGLSVTDRQGNRSGCMSTTRRTGPWSSVIIPMDIVTRTIRVKTEGATSAGPTAPTTTIRDDSS